MSDLFEEYKVKVRDTARAAHRSYPWLERNDAEQILWVYITENQDYLAELDGRSQSAHFRACLRRAQLELRKQDADRVFYSKAEAEMLLTRWFDGTDGSKTVEAKRADYESPDNYGAHLKSGDNALPDYEEDSFRAPDKPIGGGFEPGRIGNHEAAMGDIARCYKALHTDEKQPLFLAHKLELPDAEAAEALNLSLSAYRSRRRRALERLTDLLNGYRYPRSDAV